MFTAYVSFVSYALAGLRVGWIATPRKDLLARFLGIRDYNVISVSGVDDELAARALGPKAKVKLLERNISLARTNRAILANWIEQTPGVSWIPTKGGNTALVKLGDIDDEKFCASLCEQYGVVSKLSRSRFIVSSAALIRYYHRQNVVPAGLCFSQPGFVRIGYVGETEQLRQGLELMAIHLRAWHS